MFERFSVPMRMPDRLTISSRSRFECPGRPCAFDPGGRQQLFQVLRIGVKAGYNGIESGFLPLPACPVPVSFFGVKGGDRKNSAVAKIFKPGECARHADLAISKFLLLAAGDDPVFDVVSFRIAARHYEQHSLIVVDYVS